MKWWMKRQEKNTEKKWSNVCPNPDNNPNCKKEKYHLSDLCRSCSKYGKNNPIHKNKNPNKNYHLEGVYIRNCPNPQNNPNCFKSIKYKKYGYFVGAERNNSLCRSCLTYGKLHADVSGKNNPMYGEIGRNNLINRINEKYKNIRPWFNKRSINIIEEYGKQNGYKFQHAVNGGEYYIKELGYFLDAYDKNKNIVIEYYERHHYDNVGKLKEKELNREKEIIKILNPTFIRINAFNKNKLIIEKIYEPK